MFKHEHRSAYFQEDTSENNQLSLQYALGQVTGRYAAEMLCFERQNKCLPHTIEFILVGESKDTDNYHTSGFMGLAPTQINADGAHSFVEQVHFYGKSKSGE